MNLKSAAFLAMIGMLLLTVVLIIDMAIYASGVMNGVVPPMTLLKSLIYVFASVTLVIFLHVSRKAQ